MTPRFPPTRKVVDSMYDLPRYHLYKIDGSHRSSGFGPGLGRAVRDRFPEIKTTTHFTPIQYARGDSRELELTKQPRAPGVNFGTPPPTRPASRGATPGLMERRPLTPTTLPRERGESRGGRRVGGSSRSQSVLLTPQRRPHFLPSAPVRATRPNTPATPGTRAAAHDAWQGGSGAPTPTPAETAKAAAAAAADATEEDKELVAIGLGERG